MLTVEQARPGAEIICITKGLLYPHMQAHNIALLQIGHVYTIQKLFKSDHRHTFPERYLINLNEIPQCDALGQFYYGLHRFKLLEKRDIQIFYDLIKKPQDKKISEMA